MYAPANHYYNIHNITMQMMEAFDVNTGKHMNTFCSSKIYLKKIDIEQIFWTPVSV